jgi:teichuronic acid biosynthesis glycosyltransferase TuaG
MQNDKLVSIIVPMYNARAFVSETIESVLKQNYPNWELILVDDGSTDDTAVVVKPYLSDPRIHYHYQKNGGIGSARNNAIKQSTGTYIAPLDADDLWDPDKLSVQVELINETDAAAVFCKVRRIDENGKNLNQDMGIGAGYFTGFRSFFLMGMGRIIIPNLTVLIRKDVLNEAGNYRESVDHVDHIEDFDLWARLMLKGHRLYGIDRIMASYRIHTSQLTNVNDLNLAVIGLLEHMYPDFPGRRRYFKMLIINRLLQSVSSKNPVAGRKDDSSYIDTYMNSRCIDAFAAERALVRIMGFQRYLYVRMMLNRRFRKLSDYLDAIEN